MTVRSDLLGFGGSWYSYMDEYMLQEKEKSSWALSNFSRKSRHSAVPPSILACSASMTAESSRRLLFLSVGWLHTKHEVSTTRSFHKELFIVYVTLCMFNYLCCKASFLKLMNSGYFKFRNLKSQSERSLEKCDFIEGEGGADGHLS